VLCVEVVEVVAVVVKLYFNTVNPFKREIYTNIIKRDKNDNYTN